jgi:hypothetical protein
MATTVLGGVPILDWSIIGELPETIRKARQDRTLREIGARVQSGEIDFNEAAKHIAAVKPELMPHLAQLAQSKALQDYNIKRDERDFGFRQQEAERAQRNNDRTFTAAQEGTKVPPGWERAADGMRPIPGGPADPEYIRAKEKPRQFSVNDITKLSEEGGKFANLGGFMSNFKDGYAGYRSATAGNMAMTAGRYVPELTGKNTAEAASFWQNYDKFKNVVRNELFGAALTPSEQSVFERADVNPGMDPAQIRKNLAEQHRVMKAGIARKAQALVQSGFDPKAIASSYGVDVKDLGIEDKPKLLFNSTATPEKFEEYYNKLPVGAEYRAPDGQMRVKGQR